MTRSTEHNRRVNRTRTEIEKKLKDIKERMKSQDFTLDSFTTLRTQTSVNRKTEFTLTERTLSIKLRSRAHTTEPESISQDIFATTIETTTEHCRLCCI